MFYRSSTRLLLLVVIALFATGYAFRYLFLSFYISQNAALAPEYIDWQFVNQGPLNSAMLTCMTLFGIFFFGQAAMRDQGTRMAPDFIRIPIWGFFAYAGFVASTLAIRAAYGATLGQEASSDAGFIFGTLNYRVQADLIPPLTLLFVEMARRNGDKLQYFLGLALLAAFFLALSLITTSKAGMVYFLALTLIIMHLTGQNILKYPVRIAIGALLGVLLFIFASQLRAQSLGIGDSAIWVSLSDGHIVETLLQVVGLIANRIPGVEGLALSCGFDCDSLPMFHTPPVGRTAIEIFTYDIVRVQWANDFRSPGLVGGAMLLFGFWGGAIAVLAVLFSARSICALMDRMNFSAAALAAFLFGVLRFTMEGAWYWADVLTMLAGVATVEIVSRLFRRKPDIRGDRLNDDEGGMSLSRSPGL